MCQNLISGRIPLLFLLPRKVRNTASLEPRSGHKKRFLKFTQAGKIPHCAHQRTMHPLPEAAPYNLQLPESETPQSDLPPPIQTAAAHLEWICG